MTFLLETDQAQNLFERRTFGPHGAIRLLYQRCREAQAQGSPGQDYAMITGDEEGDALCFCVCDGVGGSFQGDYAARTLAPLVIDWLTTFSPTITNEQKQAAMLSSEMARWAQAGHDEIVRLPIAPDVPELVAEVLSEMRDTYGSETVFFGGRIERRQNTRPLVRSGFAARVTCCWMGNVAAQLFTAPQRSSFLNTSAQDSDRWSTGRGMRGKLTLRMFDVRDLHRLIIFTDGIANQWQLLAGASDEDLQECAQHLLAAPNNDDITVLDVQFT